MLADVTRFRSHTMIVTQRAGKKKSGDHRTATTCLLALAGRRAGELVSQIENGAGAKALKRFRPRSYGLSRQLQQFLGWVQLPVLAGVVQRHIRVRALLPLVNLADVKRL